MFYFKIIQYGLIISAGFGILDAIWLGILPYLNFSYGHPAPSLVFFIFLRGGLFVCWLLILLILGLIFKAGISYNILYLIVALNLTLLLLGLYGFYVEPMQISTEKIEVVVPEISRPIRLVQLSDIHVERTTRRELDLPEVIEALNPDLIVITGDYLNESYTQSPESARDLRNLLSQLHAQLGVYAVNGNVETPSEMEHLLKGLNIKTIKNEVIRVPESGGHFVILGLSYNSLYEDEINLDLLMKKVRQDDFSVLLYHKPDLAYAARDRQINLYLAGHTHGGQVRMPFYGAIFTNSRYGKNFEMGLYHLGQTDLYVSRGIGFVGGIGPRARFLCPPEVVVIDLIPAKP